MGSLFCRGVLAVTISWDRDRCWARWNGDYTSNNTLFYQWSVKLSTYFCHHIDLYLYLHILIHLSINLSISLSVYLLICMKQLLFNHLYILVLYEITCRKCPFFDLAKTEAFSYTSINILLTLDANNKMLNNHTFS